MNPNQPAQLPQQPFQPLPQAPVPTPASRPRRSIVGIIVIIVLAILSLVFLTMAIIFSQKHSDLQANFDSRLKTLNDEKNIEIEQRFLNDFTEKEKEPFKTYRGPEVLGGVSFQYPKTWSVYVRSENPQEVYFYPEAVPTLGKGYKYALILRVRPANYDEYVKSFDARVKKEDLKNSRVIKSGTTGLRYDGKFTKEIHGSLVVFQIRDKILTLQTQTVEFENDFNKILEHLEFNK